MVDAAADAAADDPGASSAPPSASRRRVETDPADGGAPPGAPAAKNSAALLGTLRADVLAAAEGAMRGDEVAAVSAMVTATETAALREALAGGVGLGTATPASEGETGAATTAAVFGFGARRRLGLEVGAMAAREVFGDSRNTATGVSKSEATEAPSSWPGSASALAALGYSEGGWESAGKSTAATATEPENEWRAPGDGASQPAMSRATRPGDEPLAEAEADVAEPTALEDGPAVSEREDEEDEEDAGDWAIGGTQIETVPTDDASDDEENAEEEDVGGTQIAPEEEDVGVGDAGDVPTTASPAPSRHRPSPAPSRSPVGPPPSFLRLASKPAATLPRRLSADSPAAETPGSLWTAAAASAGFKTPPGGRACADGASTKVAVAATSPFPLSAPADKADRREGVPETAAAPSESPKTSSLEAATKQSSRPSDRPSGPSDPGGRADRAETDVPPTLPGCTPAEVMCSYIPSTFPQSKAPTLTESSAGGEAAPVEAVAAAAAAAAEEAEEVPLSEVPLSVAMSPGAKPRPAATGGALAAAMRARRRRHELAAAGASLSLGPPADDAEPLPPARANASASAIAARVGVPSRLEGPRATAVPDASQPERSMASHASLMMVDATPGEPFSPSDPTAAGGAGGDGAGGKVQSSRDAPRPDDDAAAAPSKKRRDEPPADSEPPPSASPEPEGADERPGWAGGWGRVAGARRGDRAAPPRDAGSVHRREDLPSQESPREEDAPASPDFCLMLSQQVRDVVADAAADAPSQSMAPPPPRRPSSSAAGAPNPRRQSSIAAQARVQRLWDEKEARDAAGAAERRSRRARKPRTFFGDSQFPSQSQGDEEEEEEAAEDDDSDREDLSDPEEDSEEEKSDGETGTTPLAVRRAPRLRKPRKFFGDSQFPSQSQGDEEEEEEAAEDDDSDEGSEEEDDEALEICESDEDEAPWYVGGTQAVPETRGDADEDEDAPLPPMRDEDEGSDDDDETDARGSDPPRPAKRARRASARIAGVPKPKAKTPKSKTPKSKTPAKRGKMNPEWRGPLPRLGCPKCRHAANGCGRCRAIRAHAEFGTPLPWRAKTVGGARGAPASAPPATRGGRRVRFDDASEKSEGRCVSGSGGAKRRRVSTAATRSSLSSMAASATPSRRASVSFALALAAGRPPTDGTVSPASRRRLRRISGMFEGTTFLLSGIPSKEEVDELTELLETRGGAVRRDVPPPPPPSALQSADLYQPSQDVGAPMRRAARAGERTRVVTPSAGRTLKCLYAAAVGAPLVSPDWVRACADAGEALALEPYLIRGGGVRAMPSENARVFDGVVVSLSGDANFTRQFGVLLRHAGAEVVDAADLIAAEGRDVPAGEGPCDYVLVQTSMPPGAKGRGLARAEGGLARASKRLGVPRVRHEWAVDSLLANRLKEADETYRLA